jgi:DNA-binding transcriptional LysR family regulator
MELRQLRYFAAVAEQRHFTRAARELHVAQPALSQQIRRLEEELGLQLLARSTRRVELTEAGELLLARARRAMAELDAAMAELDELSGLVRGRVGVGAMPLARLDMPGMLAEFHARHPGVSIYMSEETFDEMLPMLRSDRLDLGFAFADGDTAGAELVAEWLFDEELVAVTAPDHPLAQRKRIKISALAGEPLIWFRGGSAMRRAGEAAFAEAGLPVESAFETIELETMRALAARGLGVAIMPRGYLEGEGPRVSKISLQPQLRLPVALLWRADRRRPPAAEAFLDFARERLGV